MYRADAAYCGTYGCRSCGQRDSLGDMKWAFPSGATQYASPWQIQGSDFPITDSASARLEFLVRYAVLAPSTHNSQPWLFRVRGEALELFADRSRSLPVCDPHDRELTISCGAALGFARLAAHNFGRETHIDLLPSPRNPDLLARLRFGISRPPSSGEARRFRAIPERHTARRPFTTDPVADDRIAHLRDLVFEPGIALTVTADRTRHEQIGDLVAHADRRQMTDRSYRRELAQWVRSSRASRADGMSVASFGICDRLSRSMARVMEWLDIGFATAAKHQRLTEQTPWLGLLTSERDDERSWLRTGMALADILLEATADGIACSFLNQPIEVPELRPRLASIFGTDGSPQMLIRLGRTENTTAAARREPRHVIGG